MKIKPKAIDLYELPHILHFLWKCPTVNILCSVAWGGLVVYLLLPVSMGSNLAQNSPTNALSLFFPFNKTIKYTDDNNNNNMCSI